MIRLRGRHIVFMMDLDKVRETAMSTDSMPANEGVQAGGMIRRQQSGSPLARKAFIREGRGIANFTRLTACWVLVFWKSGQDVCT